MTAPTNPERLVARTHVDSAGLVCVYAVPDYAEAPDQRAWEPYEPSEPAEYLRHDVAARETAEAVARLRAIIEDAVAGFKAAREAEDPADSNAFLNETIRDLEKAAKEAPRG